MATPRRLRATLTACTAAAAIVGLGTANLAFATATMKNTTVTCSVTANQPVLSGTKMLTGSAKVTCTATAATSITITIQIVEKNGTTVNTMNNAFFLTTTKTINKGQTITWNPDAASGGLTTPAKACVNTDGSGAEDYFTIATIVQGKSTAKEEVGKTDGWQC